MQCNHCGNKKAFKAMITDYKPLEIWEFEGNGKMRRYFNPAGGECEIKIACATCDSEDVDYEDFEIEDFCSYPAINSSQSRALETKTPDC